MPAYLVLVVGEHGTKLIKIGTSRKLASFGRSNSTRSIPIFLFLLPSCSLQLLRNPFAGIKKYINIKVKRSLNTKKQNNIKYFTYTF